MRKAMLAFASLVSALGCAQFPGDALAAVTRFDISSKTPYGSFKPGEYSRWDAIVTGELSPAAETIADLDKAPRNARGMVEYKTRVTLLAPSDPARGNGALLIDVPNRSRSSARACCCAKTRTSSYKPPR